MHPPPFSLSPTSGLPPPLHQPPRGTGGASSLAFWNVQGEDVRRLLCLPGIDIFIKYLLLGLANG
ncbi:hypothetical protein C0J52_24939 [Blattella germanica]|nr:hypothetical protein C0J52_24939 [Blattella germanica]